MHEGFVHTSSASGSVHGEAAPQPVIVDTDMEPDDWMAILYLLQHPGAHVRAVAVSGTGEVHGGPGARSVRGVLTLGGKPEIPSTSGRRAPNGVGRRG